MKVLTESTKLCVIDYLKWLRVFRITVSGSLVKQQFGLNDSRIQLAFISD